MNPLFLPTIGVVASFGTILVLLTLYSLWNEEHKNKKIKNILLDPLKTASDKSNEILQSAMGKANEIVAEAELAGIRSISQKKLEATHIERAYEKDLEHLTHEIANYLNQTSEALLHHYGQFVTESEQIISHHLEQNQKTLDQHLQAIVAQNEEKTSAFFTKQHEAIETIISQELTQSKQLIDRYQALRENTIDEHSVDILEKAIALILHKRLSLTEHTDLIEEALIQAKTEGFFGEAKNL